MELKFRNESKPMNIEEKILKELREFVRDEIAEFEKEPFEEDGYVDGVLTTYGFVSAMINIE